MKVVTFSGGAIAIAALWFVHRQHREPPAPPLAQAPPPTKTISVRPPGLKVGDLAPPVTLSRVQDEPSFDLADFHGRPVVLLFGSLT